MTLAANLPMSPDEFLVWERGQPERHTYFRGHVDAMAGGSLRHSLLASRIIMRFGEGLRGHPCDVFTSDLRLGIESNHFVYADVTVVCRPPLLRPGTTDVVLNPRVIVEVLSRSTEAYDRGDKQAAYLALPSLDHYVLVSQREARVEVYTRQGDGSFRFTTNRAGAITLGLHGLSFDIEQLYSEAFDVPGDEA